MKVSSDYTFIQDKITSVEKNGPHLFIEHIIPKKKLSKKITHIVFQHGAIEYHRRHRELFEYIAQDLKADYVISSLDLVGHGKSGGDRGHVSSFNVFTRDWVNFLEHCRGQFYDGREVETIVISHSLGGLVVLNTIFDEKRVLPVTISKTIFCNPCLKPKLEIPDKLVGLLGSSLFSSIEKIRLPLIYSGQDLTHDSEKVIEFSNDPLISKAITINFGLEVLKACEFMSGQSYFYPYPALFLISGDDRVVDNEKTKVFLSGMEKDLVEKKIYPGMLHDLLNETCRTAVFEEIMNYIKK